MKYFVGPMSKNIVDSIIEYSNNYNVEITLIPSRRQIDYCKGYVNNWNTEEFHNYIKGKSTLIKLQRDHGGPGQGIIDDDGYESLKEDCKYMDIIHIDTWKKYKSYSEGYNETKNMIEFCYNINKNIIYEIGTEESIRHFSIEELEQLIIDLKKDLQPEIFERIRYLVIQCGTNLLEKENIGIFDETKLKNMLKLCNKYNLEAKEHNGDWVSNKEIKLKESIGLKNINIAPEFGELETRILLKVFSKEDIETLFNICYDSKKWEKWVSSRFNPFENKEKLILICGHYIFSNHNFLKIKEKYTNIDTTIKNAIKNKLLYLNGIYKNRTKCIYCESTELNNFFENDTVVSLSQSFTIDIVKPYTMPFNILVCDKCYTFQNKYLGNLNIIYENNHVDSFGNTKNVMFDLFKNFIIGNNKINGIIEVGASHDYFPRIIKEMINTEYYIIEPSFHGNPTGLNIIDKYVEEVNLSSINANTIIMSSVFEHFYEPINLIRQLSNSKNIEYIYFNHPDYETNVETKTFTLLNSEHTFYIEADFFINYFKKYGFKLNKRNDLKNHSLFLEFQRDHTIKDESLQLVNINSIPYITSYFNHINSIIKYLNPLLINKSNKKYYIWPASAHSMAIFINDFRYDLLDGMLDNSPNKIHKYSVGYGLKVYSFDEMIKQNDPNTSIIITGAGKYLDEIDVSNLNIQFIKLSSLKLN